MAGAQIGLDDCVESFLAGQPLREIQPMSDGSIHGQSERFNNQSVT